jgi:hypothetical protein
MGVFDDQDPFFEDDNLALDALYTHPGGSPVRVRVIPRNPDADALVQGIEYSSATSMFDIRVAELLALGITEPLANATLVPGAIVGGVFVPGAETFIVQGTPNRNDRRTRWHLDTRPQ